MKETVVLQVNPQNPELEKVNIAASFIKQGGTVAFPTETVYGLGADAFNEEAVQGIFLAKGRPADNPLIVHVVSIEQVAEVADEISLRTRRIMEAFWPGPLTLVLSANDRISKVVTGGLNTIAVRMPDHPVALALIKASGVPLAAPSANRSGKPSPTQAAHVVADLGGRIDGVLDGGAAKVGLESTVLDITGDPPVVLRPGGVTREELESVLGHVDVGIFNIEGDMAPMAPGMKYRHYAPGAKLVLVQGANQEATVKKIQGILEDCRRKGLRAAVMVSRETAPLYDVEEAICGVLGSRQNLKEIAENLFGVLRALDAQSPDIIISEGFSESGLGQAIMNRLVKAAEEVIKA